VPQAKPRVVIIGAGFGGLTAARRLASSAVDITILDRKNHHTFQPLLYQVALAVLSPAEIATPIRAIFSRRRNVEVLLGEVVDVDLAARTVKLSELDVPVKFDYLVVAAGATHAYFGHDEWAKFAPGLKSVEDALEIRRRVLLAFEHAELMAKSGKSSGIKSPLNFVIIGAGPTGVELAGAIADIAKRYMEHDFRSLDSSQARVLLLEGGPRVLAAYPPDLSASAEKQLTQLGVEVRTNALVTGVTKNEVRVGGEVIPAEVILWAAGVAASPLGKIVAERAGAGLDKAGRVRVNSDLSVGEHRNVFVIGDLATTSDENGKPVPGVAPAAMQMGKFVADAIRADLGKDSRGSFSYLDKGSLATIGRSKAVADIGNLHISGFFAWMAWLFVHILFLIGFRSRVAVMIDWASAYFTFKESARLITDRQ
jgi:NADH dehydrogenase